MTSHPDDDRIAVHPISAAGFVVFQLVDHWGNRTTPRPRPRADVLAASLLLEIGCSSPPAEPSHAATTEVRRQESAAASWRAAVDQAARCGRYVEYLVSHHVSSAVASRGSSSHAAFLAEQSARRELLLRSLAEEPRYRAVLSGSADATNRSILRICCEIVGALAAAPEGEVVIDGLPQRAGTAELRMRRVADRSYRLRPWPFAGRRLRAYAEGLIPPVPVRAETANLEAAREGGKRCTFAWTLLAPGTPAD